MSWLSVRVRAAGALAARQVKTCPGWQADDCSVPPPAEEKGELSLRTALLVSGGVLVGGARVPLGLAVAAVSLLPGRATTWTLWPQALSSNL